MLVRNTLLYLPAQIIGPAAQFASILVFTYWMAPEPYGLLTFIFASQDFVFLLSLSWWSQYTVRYFEHGDSSDSIGYRRSEGAILMGTIVLQVATTLASLRIATSEISGALALAAIVYTVPRCLVLHLGERARAQHRIFDYSLAQSLGPIAGLVLALLCVTLLAPTLEIVLTAYGIAQIAILLYLAARQRIDFRLKRPDGAILRRALLFGLPLIASGVAAWAGMNAIRIVVDRVMGPTEMGLIAVGWGLGSRLTATAAMLVTVAAYPLAVASLRAGAKEDAYNQIMANGILMLGILLPASVGLYLVQVPLVTLLVAHPFQSMTLAVLPAALAAGLFRNIRTHIADQLYMLIEETMTVLYLTIGEAACVIVGCLIGVAIGGAPGAAIGSACGYGVAMLAGFWLLVSWTRLDMPWRDIGGLLVATTFMGLTVSLVPEAAGGPLTQLALKITVGVLAYSLAIVAVFPVILRQLRLWRRGQLLGRTGG